MKAKLIMGIALLLLLSSVSYGDDEITWNSLDAEQKKVLAQFAGDWDGLPPQRRARLVRGASHWAGMNDKQRKEAQSRFADWRNLSDARRPSDAP